MVIYQRSQAKKLPRSVRELMRHKFNLPAEYVSMLRCLESTKLANGSPIRVLSIFSPVRAREHHLRIRTIDDLRQHPEMVLFRGQIDSRGAIEVTDRRGPVWDNGIRH